MQGTDTPGPAIENRSERDVFTVKSSWRDNGHDSTGILTWGQEGGVGLQKLISDKGWAEI
ncbi:MAG: hypothetical protein CMJ62_06505 [Planctomycetaceae bacterium]|nr:hypothetical protein [Planctomycetaceae bacterium]